MNELDGIKRKDEAERRVRIWINAHVSAMEREFATKGSTYFDESEVARMGPEMAQEIDAMVRAVNRINNEDEVLPKISAVLAGRDPEARKELRAVVDEICEEIGLREELAGPNGSIIERVVLRGCADLIKERIALEYGEVVPIPRIPNGHGVRAPSVSTPKAAAALVAPTTPAPPPSEPLFFSHWDGFVKNKLAMGEWGVDMPTNAGVAKTMFTALKGNLAPSAITKQIASEFRAALLELPRYYDKDARWRSLPLSEVEAAVAEHRKRDDNFNVSPLSRTTVNKHITNLGTFWNWCHANGRIPETTKNPFLGLTSKRLRGKAARESRPQWPEDLENKLFTSPVWSGCASLHRRTKSGPNIFRDALFWVPILGRVFGARSDEICSRRVGDIKFSGDIAYLEIRRSKNLGSSRDLPFSEFLHDLGFLEHRYYGRDKSEFLFPELIAQGTGERHSEAFSNRFTYYRQKVGAYDALTDFHAFRHNVTTQLANMPGVNAGWVDEITGHASEARTSESTRYTKLIYLKNLKSALDQVRIGADLSHLRVNGPRGVTIPGAQAEIKRFEDIARQEMAKKSARKTLNAKATAK